MLKTGIFTTLRLSTTGTPTRRSACDPDYAQGQEFSAFLGGCKPWYGANKFIDPPPNPRWWNTSTKLCPQRDGVLLLRRPGRGVRCELEAEPLAVRADRSGVSRPARSVTTWQS